MRESKNADFFTELTYKWTNDNSRFCNIAFEENLNSVFFILATFDIFSWLGVL